MKGPWCWKAGDHFLCCVKGKEKNLIINQNVADTESRSTVIQDSFWFFFFLFFRCPKEVYPHVSTIINICLKYLTYDPNYNYDDEDEDENAMDADGGDDDDQGISN